jgi:hypothetical protein
MNAYIQITLCISNLTFSATVFLSLTIIKLKNLYIFYQVSMTILLCLVPDKNPHIFRRIVIFHGNRVVIFDGREIKIINCNRSKYRVLKLIYRICKSLRSRRCLVTQKYNNGKQCCYATTTVGPVVFFVVHSGDDVRQQ